MDYAKLGNQEFVMEQFFDRILEDKAVQYNASSNSTHCSDASSTCDTSSFSFGEKKTENSMKAMSETDVERSKKLMARLSVKKFHQ